MILLGLRIRNRAFQLAVMFSKVGEISKLECESERERCDTGLRCRWWHYQPSAEDHNKAYRDALHIQMKHEQSVLVWWSDGEGWCWFSTDVQGNTFMLDIEKNEERSTLCPMIKNIYQNCKGFDHLNNYMQLVIMINDGNKGIEKLLRRRR